MGFPRVNGLRGIEFGNPGASREELISLILEGNKRATAGTLQWDYEAENEIIETHQFAWKSQKCIAHTFWCIWLTQFLKYSIIFR